MLRLEALLGDPTYGLKLVEGPGDAARLPVKGIHSSDYERPTAWLDESWVLLTNGLRLVRRVDRQRALVRDLSGVRATALGFGLGLAFKAPPPALLSEARALRLPVFTVPLATSFAELMRRVHSDLASSGAREFHRLSTIQQYLLGSFDERRPDVTVVQRLSGLIDATVAILEPGGRVDITTGELPSEDIRASLKGRIAMVARLGFEDAQAVAVPIGGSDPNPSRWLVAYGRQLAGVTVPAMQLAGPLLGAVSRMQAGARRQEKATRAEVLRRLLTTRAGADRSSAAARARELGITFTEHVRVVLLRPGRALSRPHDAQRDPQTLADVVESVLGEHGVRYLIAEIGGATVAVVEAPGERWPALRRELLARTDRSVRIALGRAAADASDLPVSLRDAQLATQRLAGGSPNREVCWEDLDLGTLLISEVGADRVAPRVTEILGALDEHPSLRETLVEYFACDLDAVRAASRLHVHPNTLRYRLARVEELLGWSLRSPAAISALHLALTVEHTMLAGDDAEG